MTDACAPFITAFLDLAVPSARRCICYLIRYKKEVIELNKDLEELSGIEKDVQTKFAVANRRGDLVLREVNDWLANVKKLREEISKLNDESKELTSCFKGGCCARYNLGKKANENVGRLKKYIDQSKSLPDVISYAPYPSLLFPSFEVFASRQPAKKKLIDALESDATHLVSVYGMGGVGKTFFMYEICKQVKQNKLFDEFVIAVVSRSPDYKEIQEEIGRFLGMNLKEQEDNIHVRASRIFERIKMTKKILIILDDLWDSVDLTQIGLPNGDEHPGCKVLFTTRSRNVCSSMRSQINVEIEKLSEPDSLELFKKTVGDVIDFDEQLHAVRKRLLRKCDGLPLALVTVANPLRGKDSVFWADAAKQLESLTYKNMLPVHAIIKCSYNYLDENEAICFLYCCLFPEDHKIGMDKLLGYVMALRLFKDIDIKDARNKLHMVVDKLISSCLLSNADSYGYARMHDIVRGTAIWIAREEKYGFIVESGNKLEAWPNMEDHIRCLRMSLMKNEISVLPDHLNCPQLTDLLLANNMSLSKIPNGFFKGLGALLTLDLSNTAISSLPDSLSRLTNLKVLWLEDTMLDDATPIGNSTALEILSLKGCSELRSLPETLKKLTKLKLLDLSDTKNLKYLPANVISSLTNLEELNMRNSFNDWESEAAGYKNRASLAEVGLLSQLTTLHLDIYDPKCLSKNFPSSWKKLTKFSIGACKRMRTVGYPSMSLTTISYPLGNWAKALLEKTDKLLLRECKNLENIAQLLDPNNLAVLIRQGPVYSELKKLEISGCTSLKYLLPLQTLECFPQLVELSVRSCQEMEKLFTYDEKNQKNCGGVLPKLQLLRLHFLSELSLLLSPKITLPNKKVDKLILSWPSLKRLEFSDCPKLKRIPFGRDSAPRLQNVFADTNEWFDRLQWEDPTVKSRLKLLLTTSSPLSAMKKMRRQKKMKAKLKKDLGATNSTIERRPMILTGRTTYTDLPFGRVPPLVVVLFFTIVTVTFWLWPLKGGNA